MAAPGDNPKAAALGQSSTTAPPDVTNATAGPASMTTPLESESAASKKKKKTHRGGRGKKKAQRQQTAPAAAPTINEPEQRAGADEDDRPRSRDVHNQPQQSLYRMQSNLSNTSLESEALLDHREHGLRPRQHSMHHSSSHSFSRNIHSSGKGRPSGTSTTRPSKSRLAYASGIDLDEDDDGEVAVTDERSPLLRSRPKPELSRNNSERAYGGLQRGRRGSANSKASSRRRAPPIDITNAHHRPYAEDDDYDVNNPPSVPASPVLGSLDDLGLSDFPTNSDRGRDVIIDIDEGGHRRPSSSSVEMKRRRATVADLAARDVCFPGDEPLSEIGEEDLEERRSAQNSVRARRRRRPWPDLEILDEWSREEKEERTHQEHIRAKKISEPVLVGGRLRPAKTVWHREEDDAPFRFTYFNEEAEATIHARTISDLVQDGGSFRELFIPDPPELSDSSDDEEDTTLEPALSTRGSIATLNQRDIPHLRNPVERVQSNSQASQQRSPSLSKDATRSNTPSGQNSHGETPIPGKGKRYGPRPTWWLDVLQPTDMEMKVLAKAFQIHQLTIEDILMEEPREKVELFNNYYFVNYRSFEQDKEDSDFMEPVNFYIIAFKDGVLTFHHSMTPHPANVRRRIRLLNGWTRPNPDWISYAIIDDVTDAFAPLTTNIEKEVDDIDDEILYMHQLADDAARQNERGSKPAPQPPKNSSATTKRKWKISNLWKKATTSGSQPDNEKEEKTAGESGGEMLRRVGECRKKVMGLYRLLGNKADVLKGFAKRCNEYWEVAPRHDIGMYLGDIQDHINTMTANVSHYESLLSRAHSNYVAQINIRMNERAEQNADVLGKLTVLGTIVLPMNIITGMWGMNVWVPGQEYEGDLTWFFAITAGLLLFGVSCFYGARKVYGIV